MMRLPCLLAILAMAPAHANADDGANANVNPLTDPGSRTAAPTGPSSASSPVWLTVGASHWSGDFGAPTRTDISAALFSARYRTGGLRLTASVPVMRIRSVGAVFTGIDSVPLIVAPNAVIGRRVREGLGDLTLGAAYLVPLQANGMDLDLSVKVKLPTAADSRGLSTGQTDYSLSAEVSKPFGRLVPSASIAYRSFGDSGDWRLRDGFGASLGAAYLLSPKAAFLLSYDYAEAASAFVSDSHEIIAGASTLLGDSRVRLTGFIGAGLSDGAADASGGLSLTLGL